MRTIALRFGDHFAPECGTITAHQQLIDELGYVWYGKMGNPVASAIANELKQQNNPKILLIHSGKQNRYWAYISDITRDTPEPSGIPEYYRDMTDKFRTWFKVSRFEPAERGVMAKCIVASSGATLSEVSRHSMSPYFIISTDDNND